MTRLLCTGDLHLGAGTAYAVDRLADQAATLEDIVDVARDREVDAVLIAGDVFDRPKPDPWELHAFQRFARHLERSAIPCVAILGNAGHDQLGADLPSALELFANGDWMRVSRHPEIIQVGGVAVCTLPSAPTSRLVAIRGERGNVNDFAVAFLLDAASELRAHVMDGPHGRTPTVLLGHWSVSGASLPNGLPTSDLHEPVLPIDALEQLGFDAMVFGHIHAAQDLSLPPKPAAFYVGSPMTLNFGEAEVDHGVWILDVDEAGSRRDFVPLDGRRFVTVDVDLTEPHARPTQGIGEYTERDTVPAPRPLELLDETDAIAAAITLPITDAVIRIRYRCTEEQARRVDAQAIKDYCLEAGAHRVYQLTPDIVRTPRARVAGVDESLAPQAALDAWVRTNLSTEQGGEITGDKLRALLNDYSEEVAA